MPKKNIPQKTLLSLIISSMGLSSLALSAPLTLAQFPAGVASKSPAPNVILSIDDSGSMKEPDGTGTTRILALKAALSDVFSTANIADDSIRLGYQSMNITPNIPDNANNSLRYFSGSHRTGFMSWIETLKAEGGTPSHIMVRNAGDYLMKTNLGKNNPWGSEPGKTEIPVLECRRAYHIFMTDGGWNSNTSNPDYHIDANRNTLGYYALNSGNIDGNDLVLPDGKKYTADSNETKIYYDQWGFNKINNTNGTIKTYGLNTLADLAFYYWATDLQPNIDNKIIPIFTQKYNEIEGEGNNKKTITPYWNPKNNPATWQHMVTYTVGFGATAANWSGQPTWAGNTYAGDYSKLIQGTIKWPSMLCGTNKNDACDGSNNYYIKENERTIELWHSAINGRGKYIPAKNQAELKEAFLDIFNQIKADNKKPITSIVLSSASNIRNDTAGYNAGYEAIGWKGYVKSDTISAKTGKIIANEGWGTKDDLKYPENHITTADKLDIINDININKRLIITTNDETSKGVSFEWSTKTEFLSTSQKTIFNVGNLGSDRLNFIRGDRTKEGNATKKPFRIRTSRQGDIVNSNIWYVAQPVSNYSYKGYSDFTKNFKNRLPMLYVGGNDGMLHGFSAENGEEKIAYIPKGIIKNLPSLSDPSYTHKYYVDGSPFSGDINYGTDTSPDWRTVLVGTLGAGGKGYFILDITNPGSAKNATAGAVANKFTKANASNLVIIDKTLYADDNLEPDIGYIFAPPVTDDSSPYFTNQISRLNDGSWAVIMGNGYNSTNENPVLLIHYLTGSNKNTTGVIVASTTGNGNGLSSPRLVDINGDGIPDVVYAGDLHGNMWKFDISSKNAQKWKVAFGGSPLHTAQFSSGNIPQPITTAPIVKANDRGNRGMMVAYGTGRNVTENDRTDTSIQTIYSILDKTQYKIENNEIKVDSNFNASAVAAGISNLEKQSVGASIDGAGNRKMWNVSQNMVDLTEKDGWYMNFPESGERLLKNMSFYDGSNIIEVFSTTPASGGSSTEESCTPSPKDQKNYRTFLNIMDGKKPSVQVVDANGDGFYNVIEDSGVSRIEASATESKLTTGTGESASKKESRLGSDGKTDEFAKMPETALRPSWRQLQ